MRTGAISRGADAGAGAQARRHSPQATGSIGEIAMRKNWRWLAVVCGALGPIGLIAMIIASFKNKCDSASWFIAIGVWVVWMIANLIIF